MYNTGKEAQKIGSYLSPYDGTQSTGNEGSARKSHQIQVLKAKLEFIKGEAHRGQHSGQTLSLSRLNQDSGEKLQHYNMARGSLQRSVMGTGTLCSIVRVVFQKYGLAAMLKRHLRWFSSREPACQCRRCGFDP